MSKGLLIALVIVGLLVGGLFVAGIGCFVYINNVDKEGVAIETSLNAEYLDCQNYLSAYVSKFYETVGVANLKSDKMDTIITDAVKGRYEGKTSAQPGQGTLFSAISEAYPNINLEIYDKILEIINQGRDGYRNMQSKLLKDLANYDNFCKGRGFIHKFALSFDHFPSNALEARIGKDVKKGEEARNQMYLIVVTSSTTDAYQSGHMDPLQVPGAKDNAPKK
jgi:hypothetical protein